MIYQIINESSFARTEETIVEPVPGIKSLGHPLFSESSTARLIGALIDWTPNSMRARPSTSRPMACRSW